MTAITRPSAASLDWRQWSGNGDGDAFGGDVLTSNDAYPTELGFNDGFVVERTSPPAKPDGDEGYNRVDGSSGPDRLDGTDDKDLIDAGGGRDVAYGYKRSDKLLGGANADVLYGGRGDDRIEGQSGFDQLFGRDGDDWVSGGDQGDSLKGGAGDDTLDGGAGADKLRGDDGDDLLIDGEGRDTLNGGAGADIFRLVRDGDQDTIADYRARDRIDLSALNVRYDDIDIRILDSGRAEIRAAGEKLVVLGARLDASDFAESRFILDPPSPQGFGLVGWAESPRGYAQSIAVDGDFAYVGEFEHDSPFSVFDVSDPSDPRLRGSFWTGQEVDDIDLVGGKIYIANDANGVVRIDATNPDAPTGLGGRRDGTYSSSFAADDRGYGYGTYFYSPGSELAIYDLSRFPGDPPIATYAAAGEYHVANLEVVGDRAYLGTGDRSGPFFEIVDVSTPTDPKRVSVLPTPVAQYGSWVGDFDVVGDFAYLPRPGYPEYPPNKGGLLIVDITDETAPSVASYLQIPDPAHIHYKGTGVDVEDGRAYLVSRNGLYVIDVSDPYDPEIIVDPNENDAFRFPDRFLPSDGGYVDVQGDYAYVTSYRDDDAIDPDTGGLAIFRIAEDGVLL